MVCNLVVNKFIKQIFNDDGQSTVEFAIVTAALLVVVIALSMF